MRLIDADALIEEVWHSGLGSRQDCVNLIKEMPTKEERPRGKWDKEKSGSAYLAVRKCLNCNNRSAVSNFCMWCGSDNRVREGERE